MKASIDLETLTVGGLVKCMKRECSLVQAFTRVFSSSSLYTKGAHEILLAESQLRNINGAVVPLFVLADAAYPFLKQ